MLYEDGSKFNVVFNYENGSVKPLGSSVISPALTLFDCLFVCLYPTRATTIKAEEPIESNEF
jgi:hypothetical protein